QPLDLAGAGDRHPGGDPPVRGAVHGAGAGGGDQPRTGPRGGAPGGPMSLAPPPAATGADRLPRRLGVWSVAAVLVGTTIGSGMCRVPSAVAADVGTVGAVAVLWVLGALVAL